MIIETKSHHSPVMFGKLAQYFTKDHELPAPQVYNMLADPENLQSVIQEQRFNYQQYSTKRKGGIVCSHEMICPTLADAKADKITPEILYDLGKEYLDLRAPNAKAFLQVHNNVTVYQQGKKTEIYRPHLHISITGNQIASSKQISMRKKEYSKVRSEIAFYAMKEHNLEQAYNCSLNFNRELSKEKRCRRSSEVRWQKRTQGKNISRKEEMALIFNEVLATSKNLSDINKNLLTNDIELIQRGNTSVLLRMEKNRKGELSLKRYRLKTIGVLNEFNQKQTEWGKEKILKNTQEKRKMRLQILREKEALNLDKNRQNQEYERQHQR